MVKQRLWEMGIVGGNGDIVEVGLMATWPCFLVSKKERKRNRIITLWTVMMTCVVTVWMM